jgi:hypothetical protein
MGGGARKIFDARKKMGRRRGIGDGILGAAAAVFDCKHLIINNLQKPGESRRSMKNF